MFSPSDAFQCSWRASRWLLCAYGAVQCLALVTLGLLDLPAGLRVAGLLLCVAHACWVLPRHLLLTHSSAVRRLRKTSGGWAIWNRAQGWQDVELLATSVVLPALVIVQARPQGKWLVKSFCIAADGMSADAHRRLRVQLRFSWQARLAAE